MCIRDSAGPGYGEKDGTAGTASSSRVAAAGGRGKGRTVGAAEAAQLQQ